jgi:uncharacterized protein DUF6689
MRSILTSAAFFLVLGSAPLAHALPPICGSVPLTVLGNQATGSVTLLGIGVDVTLTFESATGLDAAALDASACLVNPLDPALLSRLPALLSIKAGFPLLLRVGPSAASGLSFTGAYTLSLHTHNLCLDLLHPLTLVKAHDGGPFADITKSEGIGSYRDDGSGGDFSEFLITLDQRQIDNVINGKFTALQALLNDNAGSIPASVLDLLQADLSQALAFYQAGNIPAASARVLTFTNHVKAHSGGDEIPDVWQAGAPELLNVAGLLRSAADTLRFSLERKGS